jgi:hypothetical protein
MTNENVNYEGVPAAPDKASGMAITALVLGILGFCCCGIFAGVPALVVGWMENSKIGRGESSAKGKGFAVAGMILGVISIILGCLQLIWIIFFGGMNVLQQMANR